MSRRIELHNILRDILGSTNVYFQPPESTKMAFPCIRYELKDIDVKMADNQTYTHCMAYTIIVIDANPDSFIPEELLSLPMCTFDRSYKANNLNHFAFTIYY